MTSNRQLSNFIWSFFFVAAFFNFSPRLIFFSIITVLLYRLRSFPLLFLFLIVVVYLLHNFCSSPSFHCHCSSALPFFFVMFCPSSPLFSSFIVVVLHHLHSYDPAPFFFIVVLHQHHRRSSPLSLSFPPLIVFVVFLICRCVYGINEMNH